MGSCLSKPERSDASATHQQAASAAAGPQAARSAASAATAAPAKGGASEAVPPAAVQASSSSVSGTLPALVGAWTAADVVTWAASLGLGPQAAAALMGCDGEQLLQLTDKGLLQLGLQDAAERQALLAARRTFEQRQQLSAQQQQRTDQQERTGQGLPQHSSAAGLPQRDNSQVVLPSPGSPPGVPDQAARASSGPNSAAEVLDRGGSLASEGSLKKAASGVRFAPTESSQQQGSGELGPAAEQVDQGETQSIQVLRITSAGRFFRHNRPVPLCLLALCQAVCLLHDVRRAAHYHQDNCHQLLQRLILVQDYLLALPLSEIKQHHVLLAKLSVLVQDAYDVFNQFSDRGWLLRLLGPVRDQDDFNRLDQQLVNALQQARVDTSEQPLVELSAPRAYQPQQQQLETVLKQLGVARLLRDPLTVMLRLQSLLNHLPSGSNIESLLQQEIDFYLSSCTHLTDTNGSSSGSDPVGRDNGPGSRTSSDTSLPKGSNHSAGSLRRSSSSSGPLLVGRGRAGVVEPFMVLRNETVRGEWRSVFGPRERITWKEFWHKLVQPQAHIWGLDRQLDKFTTDYVQQHLQRGSHGLLTLSEMDFAFPPHVSPAMVIQARLKGHTSVSSAGLAPVNFGGSKHAAKGKLPGGIGWLREVRLLQDPNPWLHNFPEFPSSYIGREEEVSELVLSMADVSTNLVMLTGAQGVGRSMLAASLAHELVSSQHWTDAYWVDMQGISNVVLAGQQLMAGLGLVSDVSDTQQLLAWLEGRPRERFGIVLTHVQDLVMAPAEEHQGFLDLLDNILHSSHKLQVVVVCEEALPRITYSARTVDVGPLSEALATEMVKEAEPDVSEEHCRFIVEVCGGAPVALSVVCNLLRYGHCNASEFVRLYSDPRLPMDRNLSNTNTGINLPFESRAMNERLQRVVVAAMVNLPDVLVGTLFVLSLLPSPFTLQLFGPLLALAQTKTGKHAVLRRLVNLGLLSYNASLQQYSVHKVVREAARLLAHNLDLPFNETRTNYAERVVGTARRLVLPLMKKNRMVAARLAWSTLAVHVVQLLNWAFQEVKPELLPLYVSLAWDLTPLLSSSCSSHTLQGFCQVVLERSQFLDANVESAKMMTVLASLLAESGALKRADTLLRQALELFWRECKDPTPAVGRCYRELGALMLKAGKAAEAAKHLQQALDIKEPLFGSTSPELLTVLQLQVELLRRSRKYAEAEHVCQRALGICGAAYGPSDVQVAFWKNQLAQVLRQAGRQGEAQSLSEEALSLLQGQLGTEHPRVAAQLMILGQLAAQQNKQAVAEQTFRKALQVYQSVSGLHHPDTFNCLTSLVALLRGAGKASQALPLAQRCLAVKKKSLGELHPDTAASMQVVADVMLDLGRYADVEAHCSRAVWVYQQINQPANSRPVITATTMQALALVLLGRSSEAEQLATSCLEAAKQLPGPVAERNSFVASCFNCLGEVYREMGRLQESEAAAREGLAMREKDMGTEHPVVAISLQTLGHVLRLRQQLDEALKVAQRCEALRLASSSQAQGPQMAAALYLQALIYADMGNLADALAKAQAALSLRQKVLSSDHPDLAHSLAAVAEVLLLQNKFQEAEPLLSHAVQIFITQLGSSHPATQRAHALLKQANNPHTASGSMSMALRLVSGSSDLTSSKLVSAEASRTSSGRQEGSSGGALPSPAAAAAATAVAAAATATAAAAGAGATVQQAQGPVTPAQRSVTPGAAGAAGDGVSAASQQESAFVRAAAAAEDLGSGNAAGPQQQQQQPSLADTSSGASVPAQPGPSAAAEPDRVAREGSQAGASAAMQQQAASSSPSQAATAAAGSHGGQAAAATAGSAAEYPAIPMPRAGSQGTLLSGASSSGAASKAAAAASTQAHPEQWDLGRQLGQPVSLQASAVDADAGAYDVVLAELTRRASQPGTLEEDRRVSLHEEGMPPGAAVAAAKAAAAGPAAAGPAAAGPAAAATAVGAEAQGVTANGATVAAAAAAASGTGAAAGRSGLMIADGNHTAEAAAASAASRAASSGSGDAAAGMEVQGGGSSPEDSALQDAAAAAEGPGYSKKLAHLEGLADIEGLTAFLREHGWQLSRLSTDDRDGDRGLTRVAVQPPGLEGSDPIPAASREAAAAEAAARAAAAAEAAPRSVPLPAPYPDVRQGSAAAAGGAGDTEAEAAGGYGELPMQPGPFAAAAWAAEAQQQQQQPFRRPPARHYSFMRSGTPKQLEAAASSGYGHSPRAMQRGPFGPAAGMQAFAGYDEGSGMAGQFGYQQQQQHILQPGGYDAVWTDHGPMADEDELAEQLYYQQQQQLQAAQQQQQPPWPTQHHTLHARSRSAAVHGAHTMSTADVAQVLEALHARYPQMHREQQYSEDPADVYAAAANIGSLHHSISAGSGRQLQPQTQQQQQHQLAMAWGLAGPAAGGAGRLASARSAAAAVAGPNRRRSFDVGAGSGVSQGSQGSQVWGPAAAAAAAECGMPMQLQGASELEQLQMQQQHVSTLYAAAAMAAAAGQQQQPADLAALQLQQEYGLLPSSSGGGSAGNRGGGSGGYYGYTPQQQQQLVAALGPAAAAAAAAAMLQGQRSGGLQQSPLSPAASGEAPQSLPGGGSRAASAGVPVLSSLLPKYPSNLSSYSALSAASSARSGGPRDEQQQQLQGHGSGGGGQQQYSDDAAAAGGAERHGLSQLSRGSRLGAGSPEAGAGRPQEQQAQQQTQQQQQDATGSSRARSGGLVRQGSGQSGHSGGDMSPSSVLSPRQQQQQQQGAGGTGTPPAAAATAGGRTRPGARRNVSFNMGQQEQQQQGSGGSAEPAAARQQQQQPKEASSSPRYAAAAAGGGPYSRGTTTPQQQQQRPQHLALGHARSPSLPQQLQQLYAADEEEQYGPLSPGQQQQQQQQQQHYMHPAAAAAAEAGHWQQQDMHGLPPAWAALAGTGSLSSGHYGPPPPSPMQQQYPYLQQPGTSGPASAGRLQVPSSSSTSYAMAAALAGMGPQAVANALSGGLTPQQQQQQALLAALHSQHAAAADAAAWEAEMAAAAEQQQEECVAAARMMLLQRQVQNVVAARAELQTQTEEIQAIMALKHLPEAGQQQVLNLLAAQQLLQQQQQQQSLGAPHLNLLGASSGSNQSARQQQQQQQGMGPLEHLGPQSGLGHSPRAIGGPMGVHGSSGLLHEGGGGLLQRATSTASTASLGSPKSAHSARTRAAAAAAGGLSSRPGTPQQAALLAAAAAAAAAAGGGSGDAVAGDGGYGCPGDVAAAEGQQHQYHQQQLAVAAAGSGAASPGSSLATPGSPTGSRSTPSRSGLSRGPSGNYEGPAAAAVAGGHGLPPTPGSTGMSGLSRTGTAPGGSRAGGLLSGQRSISPDRVKRPASAAAVLGPQQQQQQQQQRPLHRLHRDNSYDQQVVGDTDGSPRAANAAAAAARSGGASGTPQQRSSPTHAAAAAAAAAALRASQAPGMPPMPVAAWQQQQQQYMQGMAMQQQQGRRPARMMPPPGSPYAALGMMPTSPMGAGPSFQGSSGPAGFMPPNAATAMAAALVAQQQQQQQQMLLQQQQQAGLGYLSGRQQGMQQQHASRGAPAAQPGSSRSAAAFAAGTATLRGAAPPVGMPATSRAQSFSAGMAARAAAPMQQQMGPGVGQGYPPASAASFSGLAPAVMQQQLAGFMRQQQQLRQLGPGALAAMAAAAGSRGGSFAGVPGLSLQQQQQLDPGLVAHYAALMAAQQAGSDDYGMWAQPPDVGPQVHADEAGSSRAGSSSNSRSFLAPSGGQYWQGRRSNSWSNLQEAVAAGELLSPHSTSLPRSRSSEELPTVVEGVQQPHEAQQQQQQH